MLSNLRTIIGSGLTVTAQQLQNNSNDKIIGSVGGLTLSLTGSGFTIGPE
jgi:hypothetical protein